MTCWALHLLAGLCNGKEKEKWFFLTLILTCFPFLLSFVLFDFKNHNLYTERGLINFFFFLASSLSKESHEEELAIQFLLNKLNWIYILNNLLPILAIFIRKIFLNIIYIIIFWMLLVLNRALEAWNLNSKRTNHLGNQHLDYNVVPNIVRQLITMKYIK